MEAVQTRRTAHRGRIQHPGAVCSLTPIACCTPWSSDQTTAYGLSRPWLLLLLQARQAEVDLPSKCGWMALIAHPRKALNEQQP